jgi:hypothetical protein
MLDDGLVGAPPVVRLIASGEVSAAILTGIAGEMPCPAQVRAPSSEAIRMRSHPHWCFSLDPQIGWLGDSV